MVFFTGMLAVAAPQIEWTQTAYFGPQKYSLAKEMPPIDLVSMDKPSDKALVLDRSKTFQKIHGFGGAFTEASALNWRTLSEEDQAAVIHAYFASPEDGGLGYTVGRVPIGSCDFAPGDPSRYYNFDDVAGDTDLKHFDMDVKQDVDNGIIPMILAAQKTIEAQGKKLLLFASPWSPPGWMKYPVDGKYSMMLTAKPNGLNSEYFTTYAHYLSKFVSAYAKHGIPMWGITPQNEAEAGDVGWEKCLYTPEYQAEFIAKALGPILDEDHPGLKIIGFDHNKDHVFKWAEGLYGNPDAKKYLDGIGVHWYGGLNTANLDSTHDFAPDKFILATEACNCPGVVYEQYEPYEWWQRAEHLGIDILEDLIHWCTGWVDWNLILDTTGGPNHLGNRCDANIIADPKKTINGKMSGTSDTLVFQATYFYMGHFSKYLPYGSIKIASESTVVEEKPLTAADVANGQPLVFMPCSGTELQSFTLDKTGSLFISGTAASGPECLDISNYGKGPRIDTYACAHSPQQLWERKLNPACSDADIKAYGIACSQIVNTASGNCLTKVSASGAAIGLDAGSTYTVAQALPCIDNGPGKPSDPTQTFDVVQGDGQGFPNAFPVRYPAVLTDSDQTNDHELCLQPFIAKEPEFDAVAFETPEGTVSIVAMNKGDDELKFTIYDDTLGLGAAGVTVPPHSIQSFVVPAKAGSAKTALPALPKKAPPKGATTVAAANARLPTLEERVVDDKATVKTKTMPYTKTLPTMQAMKAPTPEQPAPPSSAWVPTGLQLVALVAAAVLVGHRAGKGGWPFGSAPTGAAKVPMADAELDYASYEPPASK